MSIPQLAIDRYLRLRHKSDDLFAARREAQEAWMQERTEVGRLEGHIRSAYPNLHIEIDNAGTVTHTEYLPGQLRMAGHAILSDGGRNRKTRMNLEPGTEQNVQLLLAARRRLAQADTRRQHLNETGNGLAQLVEECETALRRRGWRPSGGAEVRGSGIIGVAR
jgi:hypothetical protein